MNPRLIEIPSYQFIGRNATYQIPMHIVPQSVLSQSVIIQSSVEASSVGRKGAGQSLSEQCHSEDKVCKKEHCRSQTHLLKIQVSMAQLRYMTSLAIFFKYSILYSIFCWGTFTTSYPLSLFSFPSVDPQINKLFNGYAPLLFLMQAGYSCSARCPKNVTLNNSLVCESPRGLQVQSLQLPVLPHTS